MAPTAAGAEIPTIDEGRRVVARSPLEGGLREAEGGVLGELEVVRRSLGPAVRAAIAEEEGVAAQVRARVQEAERRYAEVHDQLLALIARQGPVAADLRLAMALLHANDRVERIGAQTNNIATLSEAMPERGRPSGEQFKCLSRAAILADEQLIETRRVFAERDIGGALRLAEHDRAINEQNRRCFELAVREGDDEERRKALFFVAMMTRAIERIGDNAVDIGRQMVFAETGRLRIAGG